jgi:hypothetical protein
MMRKIMIILVSGVGLAIGQVADASAHLGCGYVSGSVSDGHRAAPTCGGRRRHHDQRLDRAWSFHRSYGYWDDHDCSVPYSYNAFGSWNGFACYPRQ